MRKPRPYRKRLVPPADRKAFEKYWRNARWYVVGWYALHEHQRVTIKHGMYRSWVNGRKYEIKRRQAAEAEAARGPLRRVYDRTLALLST